jgi:hypothetical protein
VASSLSCQVACKTEESQSSLFYVGCPERGDQPSIARRSKGTVSGKTIDVRHTPQLVYDEGIATSQLIHVESCEPFDALARKPLLDEVSSAPFGRTRAPKSPG